MKKKEKRNLRRAERTKTTRKRKIRRAERTKTNRRHAGRRKRNKVRRHISPDKQRTRRKRQKKDGQQTDSFQPVT